MGVVREIRVKYFGGPTRIGVTYVCMYVCMMCNGHPPTPTEASARWPLAVGMQRCCNGRGGVSKPKPTVLLLDRGLPFLDSP
jgi:hypothetical protein